jgi:hypothetical protein
LSQIQGKTSESNIFPTALINLSPIGKIGSCYEARKTVCAVLDSNAWIFVNYIKSSKLDEITDIFSELKRCKPNSNLNLFVIVSFSVVNFEEFFKLKKNQILFQKTVHTDFRAS